MTLPIRVQLAPAACAATVAARSAARAVSNAASAARRCRAASRATVRVRATSTFHPRMNSTRTAVKPSQSSPAGLWSKVSPSARRPRTSEDREGEGASHTGVPSLDAHDSSSSRTPGSSATAWSGEVRSAVRTRCSTSRRLRTVGGKTRRSALADSSQSGASPAGEVSTPAIVPETQQCPKPAHLDYRGRGQSR